MKRAARPVVVPAPEWRALQKKGQVAGLAKTAVLIRATDGSVSFVASSEDPDRYGDTIDQNGWDLANYKANPVLLWAHSHSTPPVGKVGTIGLGTTGNLTASAVEFTTKEQHPFGCEVGAMVAGGFLSAVSVGFLPSAWEERYDEGGRFKGYHFTKMELLEISVVPVPANPMALIEGRGFAKSLHDWADVPDESAPMARGFQAELQGWLKAAEDVQTRATDEQDAGDFSRMIGLLERIAKASEAPRFTVKLGDLEVTGPDVASVKALCAAVTKDTKALPTVKKTCAECGAEDGCNIDCATCLAHVHPPEVAKAAPVTDAGDDLTRWLAGG